MTRSARALELDQLQDEVCTAREKVAALRQKPATHAEQHQLKRIEADLAEAAERLLRLIELVEFDSP